MPSHPDPRRASLSGPPTAEAIAALPVLREVNRQLAEVERTTHTAAQLIGQHFGEIASQIGELFQSGSGTASPEAILAHLEAVVRALQFEDIATQRLHHAIQMLNRLHDSLGGIEPVTENRGMGSGRWTREEILGPNIELFDSQS